MPPVPCTRIARIGFSSKKSQTSLFREGDISQLSIAGSSKGRTVAFEAINLGSNPSPAVESLDTLNVTIAYPQKYYYPFQLKTFIAMSRMGMWLTCEHSADE